MSVKTMSSRKLSYFSNPAALPFMSERLDFYYFINDQDDIIANRWGK